MQTLLLSLAETIGGHGRVGSIIIPALVGCT